MNLSVTAMTPRSTEDHDSCSRMALPPRIQSAFAQAVLRNLLVTSSALKDATNHAAAGNLTLPDALVDLGLMPERQAYRQLAEAAGLFFIDPTQIEPSPLALRLVPGSLVRRHALLPLAVDDRNLTYITTRPFDAEAKNAVAFASGRKAVPTLSCASDLRSALARIHSATPGFERVPTNAATTAKPVVLIADDEPITRALVQLLLDRDGYSVVEADNGERAVELATIHRPALMVMDLNMPQLNGYDAIAALRRTTEMDTTRIVVITAEDGPVVERHVLALGADDYIAKPFEPSVLTARIKALFARQRMAA
jgi:CheY-like chemotaxis protein